MNLTENRSLHFKSRIASFYFSLVHFCRNSPAPAKCCWRWKWRHDDSL